MSRHGKAVVVSDDEGADEYEYHSPPPVIHLPSKFMQDCYDSKYGSIFGRLTIPPGWVDPIAKAKAEKAKAKSEVEAAMKAKAKATAYKELFGEPDAWTHAMTYVREEDMMMVLVLGMRHYGENKGYSFADFKDESGECHGFITDKTGTIHPGCVLLLLNVEVKKKYNYTNELNISSENVFKIFPMKEDGS
ncbi:hypothetical protein OROMI_010454 [Orobanche minor]